jgi:aminopeptidase N
LIGAFAANPVAFNRPDGAGYDFVAERILQIDRFNPQLAARLLTAFRSWRTLESPRRKLAERALKNISKSKPLSRDVYEIVTRMLN